MTDNKFPISLDDLINALEGIMIECMETSQNRKQGDDFGDEYIQDENPEVDKEQILRTCMSLLSKN